jgi:hypothetical protein
MEKPNRVATVGQLRTALEGIRDDTPLIVNAAAPGNPELLDEQASTSAGFGLVNWGDGHGLEQDSVFALNCDPVDDIDEVRQKPNRPPRRGECQPQARADLPAAEPEAGL